MILFRYLFVEMSKTFAAVLITLLLIIMSGRFVKYLAQVAEGDFPVELLFQIMLYRLPNFLELIVPLAFFIAILLSYGRLYVDSEMTVMQACGFSRRRLLLYTLIPASLVAVLVVFTSTVLSPAGVNAYKNLLADSKGAAQYTAVLEGRFRQNERSGQVAYVERLRREAGGSMEGLFIAVPSDEDSQRIEIMTAERGRFVDDKASGDRYLVLQNGRRYEGSPGRADYQRSQFGELRQWLPDAVEESSRGDIDAMNNTALKASDSLKAVAALQWRWSLGALVIISSLFALALSETDHRRGRYSKMFPAFLLFMSYLVMLNAARDAVSNGSLPATPGLWLVHGLALVLGMLMLFAPAWWRRVRHA